MSNTSVNLFALDAAYKPFPTFSEWSARASVEVARWNRYSASISDLARSDSRALRKSAEIAKRATALDTGAIEGLYDVDRGFTYTVAFETAAWEVALAEKGEQVRPLFEAQLRAYDYVLSLATTMEPVSEAAIRTLHEVVCEAQDTYRVITAVGPHEQAFPKGQYKVLPNHVRTRRGTDHSYAPVDVTPAEMARFVEELRHSQFLTAHPVIQASYAHYALVVIHPFADGNGRVARALASTFTYRAISMPIMILSEHKSAYLDALERADEGDYQQFVSFMLERSLDTMKLVEESIKAAEQPSIEESVSSIEKLFVTPGGYNQEQVDEAAKKIGQAVSDEISRRIAELGKTSFSGQTNTFQTNTSNSLLDKTHRGLLNNGLTGVSLSFYTPAISALRISRVYHIWLPTNAASDDDIQLRLENGQDVFSVRMDEVYPVLSEALRMRISVFAERVIAQMLAELKSRAEQTLRER